MPNNRSMQGRGAAFNPPNRFDQLHFEPIEIDWQENEDDRPVRTSFFNDTSKSILAKNDSPDLPFTYSLNPYRGCEHGCIYCYARPSHEYLGFSGGVDFESKIMVKLDAAELLAGEFDRKSWKPQVIAFSGNTDCYQPVERKLRITRACLEVFAKYRNPVGIITKNSLVTRDLDILQDLQKSGLVGVSVSITSLNTDLIRKMEPRTSTPAKRLETIGQLASRGIRVGVMVAPLIPGLTDEEMPAILRESAARGASFASYIVLRLPGMVEPLFIDWINREMPDRASKIVSRIKDVRGGRLSDSKFGRRMKGEGVTADSYKKLFHIQCEKYGLNKGRPMDHPTEHFRRPGDSQPDLFG